jgi:hypothetical protein
MQGANRSHSQCYGEDLQRREKRPSPQMHTARRFRASLKQRKPSNAVAVALANKMARTIWAVLAHGRAYQGQFVSVRPA